MHNNLTIPIRLVIIVPRFYLNFLNLNNIHTIHILLYSYNYSVNFKWVSIVDNYCIICRNNKEPGRGRKVGTDDLYIYRYNSMRLYNRDVGSWSEMTASLTMLVTVLAASR